MNNTMSIIFEYEKSFTDMLCNNIVEEFDDLSKDIFIIPKHDELWRNIEKTIYKELLIRLNEFKINLINKVNENNELISLLNNSLYIKDFIIQKIQPTIYKD